MVARGALKVRVGYLTGFYLNQKPGAQKCPGGNQNLELAFFFLFFFLFYLCLLPSCTSPCFLC